MVKEIRWTAEAIDTFEKIIEYLEGNWTEKEVKRFLSETEKVILYISQNPEMFRKSARLKIHEAVILNHNLMIYKIYPTHIDLITFWDTRQNPKKRKF
jgi:plasmid stabilization system protein ParE